MRKPFGRRFKIAFLYHLQKRFEFFERQRSVGLLPSRKPHINTNLVACFKEFLRLPRSKLKIVLPRGESDPDPFHLHLFLPFPVLALSFFPLVLKLAEIHYFADRGLCGRGNFDKVKSPLLRNPKSVLGLHHSEILSFFVDHPDGRYSDILIYSITSLYIDLSHT